MIIEFYVYQIKGGAFLYQDMGRPEDLLHDLGDDKDFTLTPPPDYNHRYHWLDDGWVLPED